MKNSSETAYMRNSIRKKRYLDTDKRTGKIGRDEIVFILILLSLFSGAVVGAILCNIINPSQYTRLAENLRSFLYGLDNINSIAYDTLIESILKYGKLILILWFLAFLPPAIFLPFIIIFIRGMSVSFTTVLSLREFGMNGFFKFFLLYLPQNLILIPTYIYMAYSSLNFIFLQILKSKSATSRANLRQQNHFNIGDIFNAKPIFEKKSFISYLMVLLVGFTAVICAAILEVYALPYLFHFVIK